MVVRNQVILGAADRDIKIDFLTEKTPKTPLENVIKFIRSKARGKLSLQQLTGQVAPIANLQYMLTPVHTVVSQAMIVMFNHALQIALPMAKIIRNATRPVGDGNRPQPLIIV